jgi:type IV pilus assembly protein PilV
MILTSDKGAFTLVEVMVAMVVMTVGLLGLLRSIDLAVEHNLRSQLREQAVAMGERQMNWFRNQTSSSISDVTRSVVKVRGIDRYFDVQRTSRAASDVSRELEVRVAWKYKNISSQHMVKSLITLRK